MKTIRIEKYINGKQEKTTSVPVAWLDVLGLILPEAGVSELQKHGIDLPALERACREGQPYSRTIEVREGEVLKKVVLTVE